MERLPSFRVNEIFLSVQGEGLHVGERTVFVRFYGCPLHCVWCDQPEALTHTGVGRFEEMEPESVRGAVVGHPSTRRVCLTGGEPVIAPKASLLWLRRELKAAGYWISIRTSGAPAGARARQRKGAPRSVAVASLCLRHAASSDPQALGSHLMRVRLASNFTFEAAHLLPTAPAGHKCRRRHGHSFRVEVQVEGE